MWKKIELSPVWSTFTTTTIFIYISKLTKRRNAYSVHKWLEKRTHGRLARQSTSVYRTGIERTVARIRKLPHRRHTMRLQKSRKRRPDTPPRCNVFVVYKNVRHANAAGSEESCRSADVLVTPMPPQRSQQGAQASQGMQKRRVCGKPGAYPQEHMCKKRVLADFSIFVQYRSCIDTRLFQHIGNHVSH
jgi:hypothetical protein